MRSHGVVVAPPFLGDGPRLVEQRPDVRAAEANLHSASTLVGVATANPFPHITLPAGVNTQSLITNTLFGPGLTGMAAGTSLLQYDAITLKASDAERPAATRPNIAQRRLALADTTYVTMLVAQLTYQQALLNRVQAQAARFTDTAALFQVLGGGWWNREPSLTERQAHRLRCRVLALLAAGGTGVAVAH